MKMMNIRRVQQDDKNTVNKLIIIIRSVCV